MATQKVHINWIDGLKGMSAVMVLLCHLRLAFKTVIDVHGWMFNFPLNILFSGGLAVCIFIVLSAMIMTIKCADTTKWQVILIKRYFRFVLPITAVLFIYWLFSYLGLLCNNAIADEIHNTQLQSSYSVNIKSIINSILFSPLGGGSGYLGVLWMLKYVFLSPIFAILLNLIFSNMRPLPELLCVVLLSYIFYKIDPYFINVIYGFLLVHIQEKYGNNIMFSGSRKSWAAILLLGLFLLAVSQLPKVEFFRLHSNAMFTLEGCLFVTAVYYSSLFKRILSLEIFRRLGQISFEIYLLHLVVIYSLSCCMYMYLPPFSHRMVLIWIVAIVVTIVTAYVWNRYVNYYLTRFIDKTTTYMLQNKE